MKDAFESCIQVQHKSIFLCSKKKAFKKLLVQRGYKPNEVKFLSKGSTATTYSMKNDVFVCVSDLSKYDDSSIAAILCHEAVHVYQDVMEHIHEDAPGVEMQAYAIQDIFYRLHKSYMLHHK